MTTLVKVFHNGTHVANVNVPDGVSDPLEYAWRWTNNVEGSWSIKERYLRTFGEDHVNGDFNENVEVVAPLKVDKNGKAWGHRSSMVGDVFVTDKVYKVASFGFEEIF